GLGRLQEYILTFQIDDEQADVGRRLVEAAKQELDEVRLAVSRAREHERASPLQATDGEAHFNIRWFVSACEASDADDLPRILRLQPDVDEVVEQRPRRTPHGLAEELD